MLNSDMDFISRYVSSRILDGTTLDELYQWLDWQWEDYPDSEAVVVYDSGDGVFNGYEPVCMAINPQWIMYPKIVIGYGTLFKSFSVRDFFMGIENARILVRENTVNNGGSSKLAIANLGSFGPFTQCSIPDCRTFDESSFNEKCIRFFDLDEDSYSQRDFMPVLVIR